MIFLYRTHVPEGRELDYLCGNCGLPFLDQCLIRLIWPIRLIGPIGQISPTGRMSLMRLMAFCKAKGRKRQRKRPSSAVRKTAFHKLSDYQSVTNHSQIPCPYSAKHRHHAKLPLFGRVGAGVPFGWDGCLVARLRTLTSSACGVPILPR